MGRVERLIERLEAQGASKRMIVREVKRLSERQKAQAEWRANRLKSNTKPVIIDNSPEAKARLFGDGLVILVRAGLKPLDARIRLGQWLKGADGDAGRVLQEINRFYGGW